MISYGSRQQEKRMKSNYIWNREESMELGAGEQAVTKGMSTGDLLVLKIEQDWVTGEVW